MRPRVIALGNAGRGDDGAALLVGGRIPPERAEVLLAGRPGPGLLDLLDPAVPTVLLDVVSAGLAPGTLVRLDLGAVPDAAIAGGRGSTHGLGPAHALRLGRALGRELPRGWFVGVEGATFEPGAAVSPQVEASLDAFYGATMAAVEALCTSMA
ncbi:MAG: hydrogenase maturation protease [Myxococcota bacterium]